jgi:hypothetical protein
MLLWGCTGFMLLLYYEIYFDIFGHHRVIYMSYLIAAALENISKFGLLSLF